MNIKDWMRVTSVAVVLIVSLLQASEATAQEGERGSGSAVMFAFEKYCFSQPYTVAEIKNRLATDTALSEIELPSDFILKDVGENQSWSLSIDEKPFQLIVIRRLGFKKSGIQCFLRTQEDKGTSAPYWRFFRERMKANGLQLRDTGLFHLRLSGKVADGRGAVAWLLSRSAWPTTGTTPYTMLAVLYD